MSHWNHRVFKKFVKYHDSEDGEWTFNIRETYYNSEGEITMHSNEPRPALSEDLEGLKWTLRKMLEACDKEVLDEDKMVYAKNDFDNDDDDDDDDDELEEKLISIDEKLFEIQRKYEHNCTLELYSKTEIIATYKTEKYREIMMELIENEIAKRIGQEFILTHKVED